MIYNKVFFVDDYLGTLPKYNPDFGASIVATDNDGFKVVTGEEILIPFLKNQDRDWDKMLIDLLSMCENEEIKLRITEKESFDKIKIKFDELEVSLCAVVAHPSTKVEVPEGFYFDVYATEHCPKDKIFVLPPSQFLGVVVNRHGDVNGLGLINPPLVIKACVED